MDSKGGQSSHALSDKNKVRSRLNKTFHHLVAKEHKLIESVTGAKNEDSLEKKSLVLFKAKDKIRLLINKIFQGILETVTIFFKWIFKITFWMLLIAAAGEVLSGSNNSSLFRTRVIQTASGTEDKIAVVRMQGTIWKKAREIETTISAEDYMELMNYLRKDNKVKGVLIIIDSPGGEVYAADELYRSIKALAEKKPVYVYAETTLASGAYYIAMGAKKVYVNDLTTVGSIGVVVEMINYDGLLEKLGVKVRRMTNTGGRFKTGEGLFDDNPNGEEDKLMQRLIDVAYERFLSVVSKSRQLPMERVRSVADGRVMPAIDAKEYGLVDKITTLSETLKDLKDIIGNGNLNVVEYELKSGHIPFLSTLEGVYSVIVRKTKSSGFRLLYILP